MNFEFIEIKPTKTRGNIQHLSECIRVSFTKPKARNETKDGIYTLTIYIGKNIANALNIKDGERVSIFHAKENPRIWLIKKAVSKKGYKLIGIKDKESGEFSAFKFQLTWKIFTPQENEMGMREVEFELNNEFGIIVKS